MDKLFGYILCVLLATAMCFGGILAIMLVHYLFNFGPDLYSTSWFNIYLTSQILGFFIGSLVYVENSN